jgi:hypothetical protein
MMIRPFALILGALLVLTSTSAVLAQQQSAPPSATTRPQPAPAAPAMPGHGMMGGAPTMEMCQQMMHGGGMAAGGMMGPGMMGGGMMGGMMSGMDGQMDPKTRGRMLEMRGEIMKAVGDVLIKHGKAMAAGQ